MLHAFLVWSESGTEEKAARRLNISQPAVHRKLERFQGQIGNGPRLLTRGRGGWQLTEEGKAVLPIIRDLVRRFEQLEEHLADRDAPRQVIRIGTGTFAAQHILPPALAALRKKLPDRRIETFQARGAERILGTASSQFDLALVTHTTQQVTSLVRKKLPSTRTRLRCESLARYEFCLVAAESSTEGRQLSRLPLARSLLLSDLARWTLVGLDAGDGLRQRLEELGRDTPLTFSSDGAAGGWPAAIAGARHGLGVALVPIACLSLERTEGLVIRRVEERVFVEENLVSRADFTDEALDAAKAELRQAAAAHSSSANTWWAGYAP